MFSKYGILYSWWPFNLELQKHMKLFILFEENLNYKKSRDNFEKSTTLLHIQQSKAFLD